MSDDERAALVKRLMASANGMRAELPAMANVVDEAVELIEADGKRLALAEKTIDAFRDWRVESDGYAGHPDHFDAILDSYDAAKEAGL